MTEETDPKAPILPLDDGVAGQDKEEYDRKEAERQAERDEHARRTEGGDPQE